HHRPCRQTNHHHSERVLFRVGLTCGDAELWTAPRTAEPQVILATGWWPEAVQKLRRTEDDQGGHLARSMFDHDVLPGFPNGFNHSGHSLRSRSRESSEYASVREPLVLWTAARLRAACSSRSSRSARCPSATRRSRSRLRAARSSGQRFAASSRARATSSVSVMVCLILVVGTREVWHRRAWRLAVGDVNWCTSYVS